MEFTNQRERPTLRDLLAFYAEAGVDDALVEQPVNRFAAKDVPPAARLG